jgi:MFS family permease
VNFLKKILIGIILITSILAAWTLTARIDQVDQSSGVEIVLDGEAYSELKAKSPAVNLARLKENGITSLAIYQQSLEDFLDNGSLKRIEALDIALAGEELKNELENSAILIEQMENSALFAILSDSLREQLNKMAPELAADYEAELINTADYDFLYFPNWHDKLEDLNLGYNASQAREARELGLKIAYRSNNKLNAFSALKNNLELLKPDLLIFDGEEITGYPDKIEATAALMQENNLLFGNIEAFIAAQAGAEKLAKLNGYQLLRTHSMQQDEVEQANDQEIISRYLLSVRERSVKILYHKPYLKGNQLAENNLDLLSALTASLKAEGYQPGNAKPVSYFSNSSWHLLAILLGVTVAGILLLNYFTAFKYSGIMNIFFLAAAAVGIFLLQSGRGILLRQIIALGSAVIFPSLAVIIFLLAKDKGAENLEGGLSLAFIFFNFSAAVITALIGGVFVSAALNSSEFIFKINDFRGVKVAFLLPLIIISLYYLFQPGAKDLRREIPRLLESVIKVKHIILAGGLALIAVIYIGRTGNFPLLPVPAWELTVRSLLEKILYVRPRFKEFLIGHPLFIFALYLGAKKRKELYFYPLLMLASVGVITTVNTFSHLHTPVLVSLLRSFHSYWLSFGVALVLILIYRLANYLYQKYYFVEAKQ